MKKTLALVTVTMVTFCTPVHCQVTLNAGETYTYRFGTLPMTGFFFAGAAPSGSMRVWVDGASLQPGDEVLMEMFEDTPGGWLIASRTLTWGSDPAGLVAAVPGAWQDLQGSFRLRMVSGSATISSFAVVVLTIGGSRGLNQYSATVVPGPEVELTPALKLVPSPTALAIRWPMSATNFVLEASSGLSPQSQWQTVTNQVATINGMFSVTVDYELQARFFRLRKSL